MRVCSRLSRGARGTRRWRFKEGLLGAVEWDKMKEGVFGRVGLGLVSHFP
jgi:hypothetical protein